MASKTKDIQLITNMIVIVIMMNMIIIGTTFVIGGAVHNHIISSNVHSLCFFIGISHYLWLIILQHRCFIRNTELVILVYDLVSDS